jgi:hypothetical protein
VSYLDHVRACNRLDLSDQIPFVVAGVRFGYVSRDRAAALAKHRDVFTVDDHHVAFVAGLSTPEQRSRALAGIHPALTKTGLFGPRHGEIYAAKRRWSEPAAFTIDRRLVPAFGLRSYGVHVNGIVETGDGPRLWIATRADDRDVAPGQLDNMVAGGQPAGLTLTENLIKECAEEAAVSAALARQARCVGAITYAFTTPGGVKADTMFCYDLAVPSDFTPRNTDGEVAAFALMPIPEVLRLIRETDRFKFNVNLVVLDYAIRNGLLSPDEEPGYERLLAGLHRLPGSETQAFIMD